MKHVCEGVGKKKEGKEGKKYNDEAAGRMNSREGTYPHVHDIQGRIYINIVHALLCVSNQKKE